MIVGIDCSSKAIHAVAVDKKGKPTGEWKISSNKGDALEKFYDLMDQFDQTAGDWIHADEIWIEEPVYVQNPKTLIMLGRVIAGVQLMLHQFDIPHTLVGNTAWKKTTIGKGNANKKVILSWANKDAGKKFKEQDYADAYCIAKHGLYQYNTNKGK